MTAQGRSRGRIGLAAATVAIGAVAVTTAVNLPTASAVDGHNYQVTVAAPAVITTAASSATAAAKRQDDVRTEAMLRHIPGTVHVTAETRVTAHITGSIVPIVVDFLRGDIASLGYRTVTGRMFKGIGEVVASSQLLHERGLVVGDRLTLNLADTTTRPADVTIVGATDVADKTIIAGWDTLSEAAPDQRADRYRVQLIPDANVAAYQAAVTTADPSLEAQSEQRQSDRLGFLMILAGAGVILLGGIGLAVWGSRSGLQD